MHQQPCNCGNDWLTDWLTAWLTGQMADWLTGQKCISQKIRERRGGQCQGDKWWPTRGPAKKIAQKTTSPIMTIFWHLNMTNNKARKTLLSDRSECCGSPSFIMRWNPRYAKCFSFWSGQHCTITDRRGFRACNHISKSHVHMRVRLVGGPKVGV